MPYRGPDKARMQTQQQEHHFAAHAASFTWQRFVSATGGVDVFGIPPTGYWVYTPISAILRPVPNLPEHQTPAGQIAAGQFQVVSHERLGRDDRLHWNGVEYRVEGDPVQATLLDTWVSNVSRVDP